MAIYVYEHQHLMNLLGLDRGTKIPKTQTSLFSCVHMNRLEIDISKCANRVPVRSWQLIECVHYPLIR